MSRPEEIRRMFGDIHATYDFLNHLLSFNRDRSWRRLARKKVAARAGDRVLDVCAGTADLALEFRDHDGLVVASDFTPAMLARGREKVEQQGAPIHLLLADATALPFPDASFDVVTVAFGIRNVPDLDRGLAEMARVARPGARIAILEFSRSPKVISRSLNHIYCRMVLPVVGRIFSGHRTAYKYLPASVDSFPDRHELARRMAAAGIGGVEITPMNFDLVTLHVGVRVAT